MAMTERRAQEPAMRIEVGPFEQTHLDAAAGLLAARHRSDRAALPSLPAAFEDAGPTRAQIEAALARPATTGVVATVDGQVAGFLLGSIVLPPPDAFWAGILAPRSVEIPYAGYAAVGEEAAEVHREMYAALAERWVANGCFTHYIEVSAADDVALDAWSSLGFGQYLTLAVRSTEPVPRTPASDRTIEVHRAGDDEIDAIMRLSLTLWEHHGSSPMFVPFLPEGTASLRAYQQQLLSESNSPTFIASVEGQPVGIQTFHQQTHAEMARPERGIYLYDGVSDATVRGTGVGTRLLRHSMEWARDTGFEHCTLHYFAANIIGARFWQRSGFRPLSHRLARHIDPRIAWATGRG